MPQTNEWKWNTGASSMVQQVKNLPVTQETQVRTLGWEDILEKEMAIHPSILAGKISRTEEPSGQHPSGLQGIGHD